MKQENITLLDGFWDRLDEEIQRHGMSKVQLAEKCGFERKMLYNPKHNGRYIRIVYFARICSALRVSADYLLFGK
jgi:transcriptional regulator with XRE-family HTH domain